MPVPIDQLLLFLAGSVLVTVVPGPDMALVLRQVFVGGTGLAQRTIFGNLTGLVVHALALAAPGPQHRNPFLPPSASAIVAGL